MRLGIDIKSREHVPRWLAYGAPLGTILAALVVAAVPLLWLGINPLAVYDEIFVGTFTSLGGIADIMRTATPLFLTGLAVYIPLKAGLWNIGAEGQFFAGAVVATAIGIHLSLPTVALLPLMVLAGGIAAALFGAIPGYLRAEHNVNEIISSLMLTFAATAFTGYLLRGPMQGRGGTSATDPLPDAAQFPSILHPRLHLGVGILFLVGILAYLLVNRTRLGYEITFTGANPTAARQSGISQYKIYLLVFVIGGLLAGIAGVLEVAGVHGRLFDPDEFSPGYGFTAIAVALLGRNGVGRVFLAAMFFGVLTAGSSTVAVTLNVPSALIDVIVALTILFLLTAEFIKTYRVSIDRGQTGSSLEGVS